ncbi:MAG: hypothetical protein AAF497_14885 [Planctomycetota bacterium]
MLFDGLITLAVLLTGIVVGWLLNPSRNRTDDRVRRLVEGDFADLETTGVWTVHIRRFAQRAAKWTFVAYLTLFASMVSMVVGILVFVYAERITAKDSGLEKLQSERTEIVDRIDKITSDRTDLEFAIQDWLQIRDDWAQLNTPLSLFDFKDNPDAFLVELQTVNSRTSEYRKILSRLHLPGDLEASDQIGPDSIEEFHELLASVGMSKQSFGTELSKLMKMIEVANAQQVFQNLPSDTHQQIVTFSTFKKDHRDVLKGIEEKRKGLEREESAPQRMREAERRDLTRRLAAKDEEIREVRRQFDPTNIYSILPVLAVRIGIVILLIYLTQIFLAIYRYSTLLAAFYNAVGDALSVSYPHSPTHDELSKLSAAFNPAKAEYDAPQSPVEQLTGLLAGMRGKS